MVPSHLGFTPDYKASRGSRYPHSLSEEGRNLGPLQSEEEFSKMSRKSQMSFATTESPVSGKGDPEP